ncbi:MAG: polysaccharide biosynthesis/export family protein [Saprospiraceae bacterium]|nr:polysaccharide biosynthesis/export family protein [Saprospiraceae bacterium]
MRQPYLISKNIHSLLGFSGLLLLLASQSACIQHQQLINFDTGPAFDSLVMPVQDHALHIQHDDLLAVTVQSQIADPKITAPFSGTGQDAGGAGGGGNAVTPHYLVDINGKINMPLVGQVHVAGLTTQEARDTLSVHLSRFLKNPIINVRIDNFRFSVLGEVNKAGTYTVGYERVTVLEALGLAGDLTKYGNRDNILVIRQTNGQRRYGRINLHRRDVFQSSFFYLEQGDIIYVEPLKAKVGDTADGTTKYLQWALPIVSAIGLLVTLFTLK